MTDLHDLLTRNDKKEKRMDRFWICYVEGTGGGNFFQHPSLESAKTEAKRLAMLPANRGKPVYFFEYKGRCRAYRTPVEWDVPR